MEGNQKKAEACGEVLDELTAVSPSHAHIPHYELKTSEVDDIVVI